MGMRTQAWVKRLISVVFALMISARPASAQAPRPVALIPLYVSFGVLQGLDIHSTMKARAAGGREANPVLTVGGDSTLSLVLLKSASTAGVVFGTERLARSHPKGAVWLMVCLNAALAVAVAHNYSVSRGTP
ncbi:MAG TPA: hypothetical protein VKE96_32935 [Vicinamibacterales bacterium]|nr:hypothetical protein [Vicinamibacterales bacterium]